MVSVPRAAAELAKQALEDDDHFSLADELAKALACPAQQPHPEPIAWMVGTAFWWTKEEAERDAAETGLPIVGLGPMTGTSEVERLVAANTEYARRYLEQQSEVERLRTELVEWKDRCQRNNDDAMEWMAKHDTLRPQLAERNAALDCMTTTATGYKSELAERDALLVDIRLSGLNDERSSRIDSILSSGAYADAINKHPSLRTCLDNAAIEAALSASAEPEAPQSEPGKPRRCTSCDNCQGFNIGHDSSQQLPYRISCDNCHKEARAADHAGLARAWNAANQDE
jgi:hypothetical protein